MNILRVNGGLDNEHTKGEWKITQGNWIYVDDPSNPIAMLPFTVPEYRANARLIAAAPDLYTACRRLLKVAQWTEEERRTFTATPDIVTAQMIISKVETKNATIK